MKKVTRREFIRSLSSGGLFYVVQPFVGNLQSDTLHPLSKEAASQSSVFGHRIKHALASHGTRQDFDLIGTGTPFAEAIVNNTPGPVAIDGGPTEVGKFLRLTASGPVPIHNSLAFDHSDVGVYDQLIVDFDVRMSPGIGRADGLGFALLDTVTYGTTGAVAPLGVAEEPNFEGSLGVGFDIHQAEDEASDSHISLHFGQLLDQFDTSSTLILGGGQWIHARIIVQTGVGFSDVSIELTPAAQPAITVVDQLRIDGLVPYEGRAYFAARSGGESADHDIDNVCIRYLNASQSALAFSNVCYVVQETDAEARLTVSRVGNVNTEVSVNYTTVDHTAQAGTDYVETSGVLMFAPGQTTKEFAVPIFNNGVQENPESFLVHLSSPSGSGAVLGGPAVAKVSIVDNETASEKGYWHEKFSTQIVAVHTHLLPTGKVLLWPGDEGEAEGTFESTFTDPRLWDPATGEFETTILPFNYNLFCSGHAFMADGRLLIAGGHEAANVGLPDAGIYDPFLNTWGKIADMNDGRWYPTNTLLANGDMLVVSGDIAKDNVNQLAQVYRIETHSWDDLVNINFPWPLYPYMFLASDGRVFAAGPMRETQFIDTSIVHGAREAGPISSEVRSDGSAVTYDAGKILLVGGSEGDNPPTASAEVIDLNETDPQWKLVDEMEAARKYHTATLLADGTVLVTGGTSSAGFNNAEQAVLTAELWDPETEDWQTMAAMDDPRIYHSTALLLPDGRVFVAGGGEPRPNGHANNKDGQIFSPPYLFKGPRPTITVAPDLVHYGQTFFVQTLEADMIDKVHLISLSSVTHAFNQHQRINRLSFKKRENGLNVTVPSNANLAPPGYYMLFIIDSSGVPSVAHMVQVFVNSKKQYFPFVMGNQLS